ncbi:MAG: GDP-mannose 4,6-dehydratase, partial [Chloroflexi bacterium]|nr:GDP-mannose 4,6-dehydratase [Chloroflexota bacterium]
MPTALVTGAAGFAGSHLVEYLCSRGDLEVAAQMRPGRGWPTATSRPVRVLEADLLDPPAVRRIVEDARPEYVFHLAGFASPSGSLRAPEAAFTGNVSTQLHLLNAVRERRPSARVLVVGSGDEYGLVYPHELPIGEEQPFRPTSPYAVSKIAQEMLGYQAFIAYGLPVIRVRPFNHIGPRQSADFVTGAFARQIALVEAGAQEPVISVGNLDARRDFTDVRDVVRAYWLAISAGTPGDVY